MFAQLRTACSNAWAWLRSFFSPRMPAPDEGGPARFRKTRAVSRMVWRGSLALLILLIAIWNIHFFWNVVWLRGYDLAYPQSVLTAIATADKAQADAAGSTTAVAQRSCPRSRIVAMQSYLIDFAIHQNAWVPSMPQYKIGVFGIASWDATPFFDNKASFQSGVLRALRRTAIELSDILGRARGTSEIDSDLQSARGLLQYDERTWWFNPFDSERPFGPVQPSPSIYAGAIPLYERFNERLAACDALFDTRADNLQQLLDRVANDLGSTVEELGRRSQGIRYDAKSDKFVDAEGNDRGWFDFRADNYFMRASGQVYAYHGLLQAARVDFKNILDKRDLVDVWDRMEQHLAEAAALSPLIISNGREDGLFMPDHLAVMAENILRARANMTELRDILRQ